MAVDLKLFEASLSGFIGVGSYPSWRNVDLTTAGGGTGLTKGVSDDRSFETESECEHG